MAARFENWFFEKTMRYIENLRSLNPNLTWVFTYDNSISNFRVANFSVSGNPEIGNTVVLGENPCPIRTRRPKLLFEKNFANITIQQVLFLKFTEVPNTEFQLLSTNLELQIWQPCKNHGCHVKTDFIFGFYIKK